MSQRVNIEKELETIERELRSFHVSRNIEIIFKVIDKVLNLRYNIGKNKKLMSK